VGASVYYTLDATQPTTNSLLYSVPFAVTSNTIVTASAFETGFNNSFAATALFTIRVPVYFTSGAFTNNVFELQLSGIAGKSYVLQVSTNLTDWTPLSTNTPSSDLFNLTDLNAANFPSRFYRVIELP